MQSFKAVVPGCLINQDWENCLALCLVIRCCLLEPSSCYLTLEQKCNFIFFMCKFFILTISLESRMNLLGIGQSVHKTSLVTLAISSQSGQVVKGSIQG